MLNENRWSAENAERERETETENKRDSALLEQRDGPIRIENTTESTFQTKKPLTATI